MDENKTSSFTYTAITSDIRDRIRDAVGEAAVIEDVQKRGAYGKDGTDNFCIPDLVVLAATTEQVQDLMRLATRYHFPVTPRGLGTGRAGGAIPVHGGVVLSLERMNKITAVVSENMIAVVQPGVLTLDIKEEVRRRGLFYPPDPASLDTCSIGGNAATNAGGPDCIKYGTTRDYVLGLEVVLPSGVCLKTGVQTRKGVVGYDLTRLFIGSEGTLGIITELTLKLVPHPPATTTLVAFFPHLAAAMEAIQTTLMRGHVPCAMEFLDQRCLKLVGDLLPFAGARSTGAFLLVEADGMPEVIEQQIEAIGSICLEKGATEVLMAPDAGKRARMWEVRRQVSLRIEEQSPFLVREDVVVPIGRIADFCADLPHIEKTYGLEIYAFGHAGDGNIHLLITADQRDVEQGIQAVLKKVIGRGGTISGEHGIGMDKKRFLSLELSQESIRLQREIKHLFDPLLILNPGKVFT